MQQERTMPFQRNEVNGAQIGMWSFEVGSHCSLKFNQVFVKTETVITAVEDYARMISGTYTLT